MGFEFLGTELSPAKGSKANARLKGELSVGAVTVGDRALVHFEGGPLSIAIRGLTVKAKSVPSAEAPVSLIIMMDKAEELFAQWDWADPGGMKARVTDEQTIAPVVMHKLQSKCPNCGGGHFHKADNGSHKQQPVIDWYCCANCGRVESFAADPVWFQSMGEPITVDE